MPDSRSQRGPHPKDDSAFADAALATLRGAVDDLSLLLGRGYSSKASLKLVGDRHQLRDRQRKAVQRCAVAEVDCERRSKRALAPEQLENRELWIDGYNVLLTVEAALSGGIILVARDSLYRDIAAMSRHYRYVQTTLPALEAIGSFLDAHSCGPTTWFLDRPISNSGRLARTIEQVGAAHGWPWQAQLVDSPDPLLKQDRRTVATADSAILDRCGAWVNLARAVIEASAPDAWVVDLARC